MVGIEDKLDFLSDRLLESDFEHWDRLLFRDYLIEHPDVAGKYQNLKIHLSKMYPNDRVAYTKGKTEFIEEVTKEAKAYYRKANHTIR